MIDTHCHLEDYEDVETVINKMGNNKIIVSGTNDESNLKVIELCNKYKNVFGTLGIHPEEIEKITDNSFSIIENNIEHKKIVGIGEIGLDYYWNKENKEKQKELFIKQLEIAKKYDKAVIVHTRDAINDSYEILKEYGKGLRIDIHCFAGSVEMANKFIGLGAVLGIGGVLTFKNAKKIQEVVEKIDLKHFVLETDSPYLTPEPFRGKRNEPYNIYFVAKKIAEIKGISIEEVFTTTTSTAIRQFDLKDIMC